MKKEYLVSAKEMKQLDQNTINNTGLPSLVLMERAAFAVAMSVMEQMKEDPHKKILIIAGNGNNGADGICVGRILKEYGYSVEFFIVNSIHDYTEEMKIQLHAASIYEIPIVTEEEFLSDRYEVIVDAIFGIGLNRDIKGEMFNLINRINQSGAYVISVDIPSGINATTGKVCGIAVQADTTVTFGFYKSGQLFYPGRTYCGEIIKANIAINETSFYGMNPQMFTYTDDLKNEKLELNKCPDGNKGTFGKVLVIAGRTQTAGAAILCASSALRSGCGMVAVMTESSNKETFLSVLPEAMLETYTEFDCTETITAKLQKWLKWADVIVIGCGLGTDEKAYQLVKDTVCFSDKPLVCDADALQLLASSKALKELLTSRIEYDGLEVIFTPHPGELASLMNCTISDIKEERLTMVRKASEEYGAMIVAKDADTICVNSPVSADPSVYINATGNDGLATAGSGDVLAGLCGSFLAQTRKEDISSYVAVCQAVYCHGYAADVAVSYTGKRFMVASDLIEAYKYILK